MMSWAGLFSLTNLVAVLGWIALLFLPRRPLVLSTILYACVGLLCLAYLAMFAATFGGLVDAGRVAGTAAPDLSNYSIQGIRSLFMSDGGIVIGWTHYLAFDLFVGLWIARDGDAKGISRWIQSPILLVTFLAGPIGLLAWLIVRGWRSQPR
jgi:hypothetical protein